MKQQPLDLFLPAKAPSPRLKRVEREIRQLLAEIFQRQDVPAVWDADRKAVPFPGPVTVTHVKISPDLRECRVGILPLDPKKAEEWEHYVALATPLIRKSFAHRSIFRVVPQFHFYLDPSFATAERLEALLKARHGPEEASPIAEEGNPSENDNHPGGDHESL